jgi:hypothetical protein
MAGGEKRRRADARDAESPTDQQTWFYSGTKKTFTSLNNFHDAVLQSKQKGKALYWKHCSVVKNEQIGEVKLVCNFCQKLFSAANPSDSLAKYIRVLEDKSVTCVAQLQKQLVIDAAAERAHGHGQASGSATTGTDDPLSSCVLFDTEVLTCDESMIL